MINPIKLALPIVIAMVLSGCNSILYSDAVAPVYSKTQTKQSQTSTVPVNVHSRGSNTVSIERTPARSRETVVNQIQQNPYARTQTRPVAGSPSVTQTSIPANVVADNGRLAQGQTGGRMTGLPTNKSATVETLSDSTRIARANDPRIREASEVLGTQAGLTGQNKKAEQLERVAQQVSTASRPESVKAEAVKRAEAARQATITSRQTQSASIPNEKVVTKKPQPAARPATAAIPATPQPQVKKPPKPATPTSATKALLQEARSAVGAGNYEKAASALERAHRIQPSNAKILYDIAQIRYAQGKYRQAESFASKAANYSKSSALSKKIWTILANARRALGNTSGAAAAAKKAANF